MILTGMTVERCINITYPLSLSRPDTALFRSRIISVAVWVLAAICSIPQVGAHSTTDTHMNEASAISRAHSKYLLYQQAIIFHVEKAPTCADFYQVRIPTAIYTASCFINSICDKGHTSSTNIPHLFPSVHSKLI